MLNQGGSVRELNAAYKEWILTCESLQIEAYYAWLPREENVRADRLSKRVPLSWTLSKLAAEIVQKDFPDTAVTLPDLNQIANVINAAQLEIRNLLLVHPVWPASAWWNKIVSLGVRFVDLPRANITLICKTKQRPGPAPWKMRATLLVFPGSAAPSWGNPEEKRI